MKKRDQEEQICCSSRISYPEVELWATDIADDDRLKIINPGDLPIDDILEGLGIGSSQLRQSFGITDPDEIKERQSILGFLLNNPKVMSWAIENRTPFSLPTSEESYLEHFNPELPSTPYWSGIKTFIELLDESTGPLPGRLSTILEAMRSSLVLEDDEKIMSNFISSRITQIAVIEGLVSFNTGNCYYATSETSKFHRRGEKKRRISSPSSLSLNDDFHIHGHRMHSFAVSSAARHDAPEWTTGGFMRFTRVSDFASYLAERKNTQEKKSAYKGMVINEPSDSLVRDIKSGVMQLLQFDWEDIGTDVTVRVSFSYSKEGLLVNIYSIEPSKFAIEDKDKRFTYGSYYGYQKDKVDEIRQALAEYNDNALTFQKSLIISRTMAKIEEQAPNFFTKKFHIPSPNVDHEHRWFALENLYTDPVVEKIYLECIRHRDFARQQIGMLRSIALLSQGISRTSTRFGIPISFPKIIDDDQHTISFDDVYPVHLFSSKYGPVPIKDMVPVNGRIIGFTGYHGGGKTVAELGIIGNVFLAHSGLPICGTNFRFNLKSIIGVVFIERGEGSTCEMLVGKIKNILEGIRDVDCEKVVLVLDELGSATQENSGFELGKDLLLKLSKLGVSVLFSTQILSLAEYAVSELDAVCYKLNLDHSMTPGIADGGMNDLRKRYGIDELLKS